MQGRLEPRDSGSYCSCPDMKQKGRDDGIHGNRKGRIWKLFWRQKQQDLITDWVWMYGRGSGNKWLRGFELRKLWEYLWNRDANQESCFERENREWGLRDVEFHIMMEYVSGNTLHTFKRTKLGQSTFSFFFFPSFLPLLLSSFLSYFCSLSMISNASEALYLRALRINFTNSLTFGKLWGRLPSLSSPTLSSS